MDKTSSIVRTPLGLVEYAETGAGEPLLSFHGTPGGFDGALLAAELHCGAGFRVIGFSRPGYLRTPLSSGADVPQQADLAAALLDALGISRALVYGLSGGGPFALSFAVRQPDRCQRLVLGAAVTAPEPRPRWQLEGEIRLLYSLDWLAWVIPALAPEWTISRIIRVLIPFRLRAAGYRNDANVLGNFVPSRFEDIQCPVLIVHGTADRNASFANAEVAARRIPNCETLFVRGAGHASVWFRPNVQQRISRFLRRS